MKKMSLTEIQNIQLKMLEKFDDICRRHNIKYSIEGGTLLGAVKFGGFVPWDDDIDIVMLRCEYDKFLSICGTELANTSFVVESYYNCIEFPLNYAKMCDTRTIIRDYDYSFLKTISHGVFIDIFPLDSMKTIKEKNRRHVIGFWTSVRKRKIGVKFKCSTFKKVLFALFCVLPLKIITKILHKSLVRENSSKKCKFAYELCNQNSKFPPIPLSIYNELVDMKFENLMVLAVKQHDIFLKSRFGADYMISMPPEEERKPSHCQNIYWKN